jgi:hypothetical protein
MLKQVTLFAENEPAHLTNATKILSNERITIRAFTIADFGEFGIVRFIVDKTDAALKSLKKAGFSVSETDVIGVEMPDRPGGLHEILRVLSDHNINIDYAYAYTSVTAQKPILILQTNNLQAAAAILMDARFNLIDSSP